MNRKLLWSLLAINFVYIICGGLIFHAIEAPEEETQVMGQIQNFKTLQTEIRKNYSCISAEDLDRLLTYIIESYEGGDIQSENNTNLEWDIDGSIFFATTVVTTVGYGHIAPVTTGGRVFCVFYALFGIPLSLVVLGGLGMRLSGLAGKLDAKLNKGIFPPRVGKGVRAFLLFLIGFCLFVLVPGAIFTTVEDWSFGNAIYYGMITLTTIGFGDYVAGIEAGKYYGWWYRLCVCCWIWLGLAWAATVISACQELYEAIFHPERAEDTDNSSEPQVKDDFPLVQGGEKMSYTEPTLTKTLE